MTNGGIVNSSPNPQWSDQGTYKEPIDGDNIRVPRLEVDNATTYIDKDGSNNLTFTDAVTGTKTLSELAAAGSGTVDTSGTPVANDFAKFTDADTIEGRSYTETKTDLSLNNVENTAISTWVGSANITTVGTLSSGNVDAAVSASSTTTAGKVEIATAAETTTGTDATRAVSPDGLAGSAYGKRTMSVLVNDSTALTSGDGKAYFPRIPSYMNGWNIIEVAANMVAGTGAVTIMIHNLTQTADVLSTALTIDANEKDSKDAATPAVIDTAEDDLTTGDRLRIDIDGAGTGTTWLDVQITAQLP